MRIIPAIDIIDGKCVRLTRGDYSTKKIYNEKLKNLTNNILNSKNYLNPDIKKLEILQKKIEEIKKTKLSYIQKIFYYRII